MTTRHMWVACGKTYERRVLLPAGLRIKPTAGYQGQSCAMWWLDEFPDAVFPPGSQLRREAEEHGILLHAWEVDLTASELDAACAAYPDTRTAWLPDSERRVRK